MGAWALLLALLLALAQAQGCSVNQTLFQIEENTVLSGPLVDIQVPQGQQVTLGPLSTPHAFRIQGNQLFLNVTPDYEDRTMLLADLECRRGDTVVSQLKVFVTVLDVNDNPPVFPFKVKTKKVPEDTKVNTIVIPQEELAATDLDKSDILFYTLQEVTPGAGSVFSLVGTNFPALRLAQPLDFDRSQNMTLRLRVRDTQDESAVPSHSATATLVLEVQPADRRPPWFLPCLYSDLLICVQAQYQGAIPTGHKLPAPLTLRPGPIYAVDGDRGINQRIIYSILRGNEDGTFVINADSGNLTMARSVPSPKTFLLLVKGEQEDRARYSVTQVTIEARDAAGSLPRFPQSLYRGAVALGSGVGVAVKDAADPSQPLRIQAQDPEFPDLNSAITYEITNNSDFRMDGEAVLTAAPLGQAGVFYAEVQAKNTVTAGTATTVAEIQVSEQEPPPTGPPGSPTPPETGRTTRPSSSSTSEAPRPPEPSQGPSTTSSGGSTGPHPPSGTSTPEPPKPSQGPSTTSSGGSMGPHPPSGTSTPGPPKPSQGPSTTSSGGSTGPHPPSGTSTPEPPKPSQGPSTTSSGGSMGPHPPLSTSTPEAPRPPKPSQGPSTTSSGGSMGPHPSSGTTLKPSALSTTPGGPSSVGTSTSPSSATSSGGSQQTSKPGSTGAGGTGDGGHAEDQRFSAVEMGVLGGVLGSLLLLALLALVILLHKHYGPWFQCCSSKALEAQPYGFDNKAFLPDDREPSWAPAPSPVPEGTPAEVPPEPPVPPPPTPPLPAPPASPSPSRAPESPAAARDEGGPAGVRSILTKERRPEGGYKAVWFGENIGAEADVVVLNAPVSDADGAGDSGSEGGDGSDDEGADAGPGWGPRADAPGTDSTYI
ncbi:cadherin-related family member 5 isoform X1 [Myotis myotis]|uniref:cadherin-related family member 5 isoform X1 n=1 Tax=Myotis myotis TaxID=51298 RepID=UPI00174C2E9F|nr:cadherin-related family member 5 isoform X1 [Myotis myotis]